MKHTPYVIIIVLLISTFVNTFACAQDIDDIISWIPEGNLIRIKHYNKDSIINNISKKTYDALCDDENKYLTEFSQSFANNLLCTTLYTITNYSITVIPISEERSDKTIGTVDIIYDETRELVIIPANKMEYEVCKMTNYDIAIKDALKSGLLVAADDTINKLPIYKHNKGNNKIIEYVYATHDGDIVVCEDLGFLKKLIRTKMHGKQSQIMEENYLYQLSDALGQVWVYSYQRGMYQQVLDLVERKKYPGHVIDALNTRLKQGQSVLMMTKYWTEDKECITSYVSVYESNDRAKRSYDIQKKHATIYVGDNAPKRLKKYYDRISKNIKIEIDKNIITRIETENYDDLKEWVEIRKIRDRMRDENAKTKSKIKK